jgi:hypothetical protein
MSTSIKRQSAQMSRVDEPLPNRPMGKGAPLLTPEEEAAYMEALAYQKRVVEERFKAPPPKAPRPRVTWSSGQRLTIILDGIPRTISAGVPATR